MERTARAWAYGAVVFAAGVAASLLGTGHLALWFDEAATVAAAGRPVAEILQLSRHVDAVHTAYYVAMHFWIDAFGSSPLSLRVPSALAVGATGVAVAGFVREALGSARTGITAGLVTVALPRMYWSGSEARQFAFTALLATLLAWATWRAWNRPGWRPWVPVAVLTAVSVYVFMFAGLVSAALVVAAVLVRRRIRATVAAVLIGAALALPLVVAALGQTAQVTWITRRSAANLVQDVAFTQWLDGQRRPVAWWPPPWTDDVAPALAGLFGLLILAALLRRSTSLPERDLLIVALCWAAVPTLALVAGTLVALPVYVPRYLTMTSPALGIAAALGIRSLGFRSRLAPAVAVALVTACLIPQAYLKDFMPRQQDFQTIASAAQAARTWSSEVVFEDDSARAIRFAYPASFEGTDDLLLTAPPVDSGTLFGRSSSMPTAESLRGRKVVFIADPGGGADDVYRLLASECREQDSHPDGQTSVVLFDCMSA